MSIHHPSNRRIIRPNDKPSFEFTQRFGINRRHPLADALVGCWLMNEAGGNIAYNFVPENPGTLNDLEWHQSEREACLYFAGGATATNYVDIPSADYKLKNMSFSIWARAGDEAGLDYPVLLSNMEDDTQYGWLFWWEDSISKMRLRTRTSSWQGDVSGQDITDGKWHHYVGVIGDTELYLYVDGSLVDSDTGTGGWSYGATTYFRIGDPAATFWETWPGWVSDLMVFDRQLSADQVATLYSDTYSIFRHDHVQTVFAVAAGGANAMPMAMNLYRQMRQ